MECTLRPKLAAAVRTGEAAASSMKAASTLAALTLGTMSALQGLGFRISDHKPFRGARCPLQSVK